MRRLLKWVLNILTLVLGLLLAGAYTSQFLNPGVFWPVSFLGLIFPVVLVGSIILLIILVINRSKASFIILGLLLIGWNPIRKSFNIFSTSQTVENTPGVRIMSYNVRIFDNFNWTGQENSGQKLLDFVAERKPDIICFQEFMVKNTGNFGLESITQKLDFAPYKHIKYIYEGSKNKVGLAIFSKYPIIHTGSKYLSDHDQLYIYADIKIKEDTIRIVNNYLESNRFSQKQINLIDSITSKSPKEKKNEYLGIIRNMKSAYIKRAEQANHIHDEILLSPHPVIVTGDFNDTPVSYSYQTISKGLKDAFVSSGQGLGATYWQFILPLRIDYLLHGPEILSSEFTTHDVRFSDHRPIEATFWINGLKGERR